MLNEPGNPNIEAFDGAVPKLTIPLGLDAEGRPVSVTAWGRAVPVEHLYDDEFAKTHDLL